MNWARRGSHSIQSGEWIISKARVRGEWIYTLWRNSERIDGYWSANEAKKAAGELANG